MANYPSLAGIDFTAVTTVPTFELGAIVRTSDGTAPGAYRYIKATTTVTRYYVGIIAPLTNEIGALVTQTNDDTAPIAIGIPQAQTLTSGQFGWVWIGEGVARVRVSASCAIDVGLYTTATAGELDDATASAKLVVGLKLTTANGGASADQPCAAVDIIKIS